MNNIGSCIQEDSEYGVGYGSGSKDNENDDYEG